MANEKNSTTLMAHFFPICVLVQESFFFKPNLVHVNIKTGQI